MALAVATVAQAYPAGASAAERPGLRAKGTRLVGHLPLRGFNGDVWYHRDTVYVGGWGRTAAHCPVHGVRVVDVSEPSAPKLISRFAQFEGTTSEDVWVGEIDTSSFQGDIAVVGIQMCNTRLTAMQSHDTFRGLAIYDVTNPLRPELLSRVSSGSGTHGVHELSAVQRSDGRVLVVASTPRTYESTNGRVGDVRIVDLTNPKRPDELVDWDVRRDAPASVRESAQSGRPFDELLAHSAWTFDGGRKMFVSHWDAGMVFFDISRPSRPRYLSRTAYRAGDEGNAHSGWFSADETLFVQNDEAFLPSRTFPRPSRQKEWGYQRFYDLTDPSRPRKLSTFATENAAAGVDGRIPRNGFYAVHNAVLLNNVEYASWYSDGVRIVDISTPAAPREIGYFVPPARADPEGFIVAPDGNRFVTMVWGVTVGDEPDLVYATDMNSGLWIFRVLRP
jgi:hypothetical protein